MTSLTALRIDSRKFVYPVPSAMVWLRTANQGAPAAADSPEQKMIKGLKMG